MIQIRKYQSDDLGQVKSLMAELQAHEKTVYPGRAEPSEEFVIKYLDQLFIDIDEQNGIFLVAEENGVVSGFVAGYVEEDTENQEDYFSISDIVVSSQFRGQSIGSQLIATIEDYARSLELKKAGIGVLVGNDRVHDLYKRLGFNDYGIELIKDL